MKTKVKPTKLTALEVKAEEHHRKTAKFNIKKKKWAVQLPWIEPELESHRLTDKSITERLPSLILERRNGQSNCLGLIQSKNHINSLTKASQKDCQV